MWLCNLCEISSSVVLVITTVKWRGWGEGVSSNVGIVLYYTPSQHNTHITEHPTLHLQSAQYPHYRTPSIATPVSTIPKLENTQHCTPSQHSTHITGHPALHPSQHNTHITENPTLHPQSPQYSHYRTLCIAPQVNTVPTLQNTQHWTPFSTTPTLQNTQHSTPVSTIPTLQNTQICTPVNKVPTLQNTQHCTPR